MTGHTHEKSDSAIIRMTTHGYQSVLPAKRDDQVPMKDTHTRRATANGPHRPIGDSQREAARILESLLLKRTALQPPKTKIHKWKAREKQWKLDQKRLNIILKPHPPVMPMGAGGRAGARTRLKESGELTRNKAQDRNHLTTGEISTSAESSGCSGQTEKESYG